MGFSVIHEMGDDWPIEIDEGVSFFASNPRVFANYDGIVGWKWSLLTPRYAERFPIQIHLVRHPVGAIESATTHADSLFTSIERRLKAPSFIDDSLSEEMVRLGRAVNYWIEYNKTIGEGKRTIRLEDFRPGGDSANIFCELTGTPTEAQQLIAGVSTATNARPEAKRRVKTSWEILDAVFPEQAAILKEMAVGYGYEVASAENVQASSRI